MPPYPGKRKKLQCLRKSLGVQYRLEARNNVSYGLYSLWTLGLPTTLSLARRAGTLSA
jgi:hypothetical protein